MYDSFVLPSLEGCIVDYGRFAEEVTTIVAKRLQAEKGLILAGTGGRMRGFQCKKVVTLEEARKLLVHL